MAESSMKKFWDARASEDAYYFVDNLQRYGDPDHERFWDSGREAVDNIERILGVSVDPGDEIVEIGCGIGRITRVLSERAASVQAFDVSERMLAMARDENPALNNVSWILGDGTSLSQAGDSSADGVLSFVVFHHIPDPEITMGYIREMGRVLKPGGWAAFQISNDPNPHRRLSLGERLRSSVRGVFGKGPRGQAHESWLGSYVDLDRLREVGSDVGLSIERIEGEGTVICLILMRRAG